MGCPTWLKTEGKSIIKRGRQTIPNGGSALAAEAKEWLMAHFNQRVKFEEPMSRHTSFRVGGPAEALVEPESVEQLAVFIRWAREKKVPYRIMGGGTNLLVEDAGCRGVVVKLSKSMSRVQESERKGHTVWVTAMAGAKLQTLCRYAIRNGLGGLNFALGIPGTVGGAIMMNAGTSRGAIEQVLESIDILNPDGRIETTKREALDFSYRRLVLKKTKGSEALGKPVILKGHFRLRSSDPHRLDTEAKVILASRRKREPRFPSAGCFFKNPRPDLPAGRLIDTAGLKGIRIGDAQISEKHANYIINRGHASAKDILKLSRLVQDTVRKSFNIELEPEVIFLGKTEQR